MKTTVEVSIALLNADDNYTPCDITCKVEKFTDPFGTGDSPTEYEITDVEYTNREGFKIDIDSSFNDKRITNAVMDYLSSNPI